jgi:hypothetical protein
VRDSGGFRPFQGPRLTLPGDADANGVPEPPAWALMILGLAAAGAGLRRRAALAA